MPRYAGGKNVSFNEFGYHATGIPGPVFKEIANTGSQFIRPANLSKKVCNHGVFGDRIETRGFDGSPTMGTVPVLSIDPMSFDDQFSGKGMCKFAMDQEVAHYFTEKLAAKANPLVPFQKESIGEMFCNKRHQAVVAIDQIGPYVIAVIIAIDIFYSHQGVGPVMRQQAYYRFVFA